MSSLMILAFVIGIASAPAAPLKPQRLGMISLKTDSAKDTFHLGEPLEISITLANTSKQELTIPDFEDPRAAASYLFDLEIWQLAPARAAPYLRVVRPTVVIKAALPVKKVVLRPKESRKYGLDLNLYSFLTEPSGTPQSLGLGLYEYRINWAPQLSPDLLSQGFSAIPATTGKNLSRISLIK